VSVGRMSCRALSVLGLVGVVVSESPIAGSLRGAGSAQEECRQVVDGEECYTAVRWAMDVGIKAHPDWYPELTPQSPFESFQFHLHNIQHANCPKPCDSMSSTTDAPVEECRRAVEGEDCHRQVTWAMTEGIYSHPQWYPELTSNSSFDAFQEHLYHFDHGYCPKPCYSESPVVAQGCQLQVFFYAKVCQPGMRCGVAGRYWESGSCTQATWGAGHHVTVGFTGSDVCDSSTTAIVKFFNSSECNGTPDSTMMIPTDGTKIDECRDIHGHTTPSYTCSAQWV